MFYTFDYFFQAILFILKRCFKITTKFLFILSNSLLKK